jgi:Mechanosensitive ion channel
VDLQERHQLDVARLQVAKAKVKARTRPWRYIFAIVLAVVAAAVSVQARVTANLSDHARSESLLGPLGKSGNLGLSYGAAAAFCLLAGAGTIGLGNKAREVLERTVGSAHAAVVRFAVIVAGGLLTIVITLELFDIAITQVLVGGAVTGVVVGIAAQQSLANIFAGIVLLMARPFRVGDQVGIRSGALSGLLEGTVTEISITYVSLLTANGPVHVPNSQVLAAAVGPAGAIPSPAGSPAPPSGAGASPAGQTGPSAGAGASPAGAGASPAGPEVAALAGASQASVEVHADQATPAPPGASGVSAEPSGPTQPEPPGSGSGPGTGHQPS